MLLQLAAIFGFLLGTVSCADSRPASQSGATVTAASLEITEESLPVMVQTTQLELLNIAKPLIASGTIAAKQTSSIGALAEGVVERIFVKVGDRVKKGQPLFQTRQVDYERKVDEAQATLAIATAKSNNAETLHQRYANLVDKDAVSRVDFEDVRTKAEMSKAEVSLRRAQLQTAQQVLKDTIVRAPFDGAITARYIDEGVYMANRFSGLGNSSVVQIRECEIAAGILFAPESEIGNLALGLTGHLYVDGVSAPIAAKIAILNDSVDPVARTVEFRMPFKNEGCAVKAGQSVRAEIIMPAHTAMVLPRQAIRGIAETNYVYIVRDKRVIPRPVTIRDLDVNRVEVLTGLTTSDTVVLTSSQKLQNDMEVTINNS